MRMSRICKIAAVTAAILTIVSATAAPASARHTVQDGLIVFADWGNGPQIYTIHPDGSGLRQLTHVSDVRDAADPRWSFDGRHIVFGTDFGGADRIWTMTADGSNKRKLFDDPGYNDETPQYLPNAAGFAFARCGDTGCAIATVRADGTGLRMLTPFTEDVRDYFPAVSATGRIIFTRFGAHGIQAQLYLITDSGAARPVTPTEQSERVAHWSPDGRQIAFSPCCLVNGNIFTISPNGTHLHQLTRTPYPYATRDPAYSPTGTRIVFDTNRDHPDLCCTDLYIMSVAGQHPRRLHTGLTNPVKPVWAPAVQS